MLVKPPLAGVGTFKQLVRQPVQAARREPSMQDALPRPASREIPRAGNEWKRLRVPCRAVPVPVAAGSGSWETTNARPRARAARCSVSSPAGRGRAHHGR